MSEKDKKFLKSIYNSEYLCTYRLLWELLDRLGEKEISNLAEEAQRQHMETIAYQQDILEIFYLSAFDEQEFNQRMQYLYDNCIKFSVDFQLLLQEILNSNAVVQKFVVDDVKEPEDKFYIAFTFLFSFDLLDFTHTCICEYMDHQTISEDNAFKLRFAIRQSFS
jgi:hypothetical protein